ncbi:hypothetical protein SISNIDRAFT_491859 [Sistotremastrum niveocremeum HHB9708]|uniref:DUF6535 domain-containing protein n=1 Tax=Sistotremastrum niveocremeum HHB9708 TaxID=1314777 RepID=A0A164MB87_9AGAM|nr:hypothetical protein SISNIDRAFT_491859 [Sistotremastrum niveocremeum HHB9708]
MSDPTPPPTEPTSTTNADGEAHEASVTALLTSQFGALLDAVKILNVTMDGVKTTLVDHGKKFDILTRDALKNDQAYDQKDLEDESTCMALYDMVMAKTKEKADEWKETMEVTLIFIALFSAVLTAFLVPATQALLPNSGNSGNLTLSSSQRPPLPPRSAEAVCAFYYLSLITAIIIAVLCALGRRWVRKLTTKPNVKTWREKMFWHIERMHRAESWLQTLMEVLYWMLLSSIGLFMGGLLYQLWNLSGSFEKQPPILLATWALGVILASGVAFTMVATTYHAIRYEASIFEGLISKLVVGQAKTVHPESSGSIGRWLRSRAAKGRKWFAELKVDESLRSGWARVKTVKPGDVSRIQALMIRKMWTVFNGFARLVKGEKVLANLKMNSMMKASHWIERNRAEVECESIDQLLLTYLDQIAEASDPSLLDRAVASLSYRDWVQHGDGSVERLQQVFRRLMATDTSFRVKETVSAQISRFSVWISERRDEIERNRRERAQQDGLAREGSEFWIARSREREAEAKQDEKQEHRAIELTKFLLNQRTDRISRWLTPTWENYTDILNLLSLPFDNFMAKCICINDHHNNLGDHKKIFLASVDHCRDLLESKDHDDVTHILMHLDFSSAVKSFVLAATYFPFYNDILRLIVGDRTTEVLHILNEIFSTPRDWSGVDPSGASSVFLIAAGSSSQFSSDLDLSPIIAHLAQHPSWEKWRQASQTLMAYLVQSQLLTLSDPAGVHHFLRQCVLLRLAPPPNSSFREIRSATVETRETAVMLLDRYVAFVASSIPLPPSPLSISDDIVTINSQDPDLDIPNLSDSDGSNEAAPSPSIYTVHDPLTPPPDPLVIPSTPFASPSSATHHVINMTNPELRFDD